METENQIIDEYWKARAKEAFLFVNRNEGRKPDQVAAAWEADMKLNPDKLAQAVELAQFYCEMFTDRSEVERQVWNGYVNRWRKTKAK